MKVWQASEPTDFPVSVVCGVIQISFVQASHSQELGLLLAALKTSFLTGIGTVSTHLHPMSFQRKLFLKQSRTKAATLKMAKDSRPAPSQTPRLPLQNYWMAPDHVAQR